MTIVECIKHVLSHSDSAMSAKEIYEEIVRQGLYSFGAQDPVGVVNAQIRRRCVGLDFPTSYPTKCFELILSGNKRSRYRLFSGDTYTYAKKAEIGEEQLPEEIMEAAFMRHIEALGQSIYRLIQNSSPSFFEHLVIDLLLKMGYGYDRTSGVVTGKSHDGGIDGIISEDKLGLGLIYVQAKRYAKNNKVGRKEVQAFIGAMEHVQKGVFITTSTFTHEAWNYVEQQQQKSIKLIDGETLTDLLIKYEIGIQPAHKFTVYMLDSDYYGNQ